MNLHIDLIGVCAEAFKASLIGLNVYLWALPSFFLISVSAFYLFPRGPNKRSLLNALRAAFPAQSYRNQTSKFDMIHTFVRLLLYFSIMKILTTILVGVSVRELLNETIGTRVPISSSAWVVVSLQFFTIYLANEFAAYLPHYLLHKIPWLWSIHRLHHSAEALTIFSTQRSHILENLLLAVVVSSISGSITGVVLYLFGTPLNPLTTSALVAVVGTYGPLIDLLFHSHVWISYGKLNYIFSPPIFHQIHHSAEIRHRDTNFGSTLTIFDWWLGTLYLPKGREEYRWGLNDEEIGENNPHNSLRGYYIEPIQHMWRTLCKRKVR